MAEAKRKFAIWLSEEQAILFDAVYRIAKARDGRTNYSEVIKELMGFKLPPDVKPVTTEADRKILAGNLSEWKYNGNRCSGCGI